MAEMAREQAIENLKYLYQYLPSRQIFAKETLDTAIAALRQGWVRTAERVPEGKSDILFVVHIPAWVDKSGEITEGDVEIPGKTIVVSGHFETLSRGRYWSWTDEISECVIKNEICKEECGSISYVTHWMPYPLPPLPE